MSSKYLLRAHNTMHQHLELQRCGLRWIRRTITFGERQIVSEEVDLYPFVEHRDHSMGMHRLEAWQHSCEQCDWKLWGFSKGSAHTIEATSDQPVHDQIMKRSYRDTPRTFLLALKTPKTLRMPATICGVATWIALVIRSWMQVYSRNEPLNDWHYQVWGDTGPMLPSMPCSRCCHMLPKCSFEMLEVGLWSSCEAHRQMEEIIQRDTPKRVVPSCS